VVVAALSPAGLTVSTDAERDLDHGAWMPLRVLFPTADVPMEEILLRLRRLCHPKPTGQSCAERFKFRRILARGERIDGFWPPWPFA
jgi:hypothetical protein